jgi:arylsulfatase A-like enzyme
MLATGPDVVPGHEFAAGHILDFAPTLLALLGVSAPQYMPGRVWPQVQAKSR